MQLRIRIKWKVLALWIGLAALVIWGLSRLFAWSECSWYGYQTGRDTRYAAFIGCMVQTQNQWVPRSELRVLQ